MHAIELKGGEKEEEDSGRTALEMRGGPSKPVCRDRLQTTCTLRRLRAGVVSGTGKGAKETRQVRIRETNASEPLMKCRKPSTDVKTGSFPRIPGSVQRKTCLPSGWRPAFRWREPDSGSSTEHGNLSSRCQGRSLKWKTHEDESTEAGHRGGAVRSSDEAFERRVSKGAASSQL